MNIPYASSPYNPYYLPSDSSSRKNREQAKLAEGQYLAANNDYFLSQSRPNRHLENPYAYNSPYGYGYGYGLGWGGFNPYPYYGGLGIFPGLTFPYTYPNPFCGEPREGGHGPAIIPGETPEGGGETPKPTEGGHGDLAVGGGEAPAEPIEGGHEPASQGESSSEGAATGLHYAGIGPTIHNPPASNDSAAVPLLK